MSVDVAEEPLVSVNGLRVVFPPYRGRPAVRAVDDVSFAIAPGRTLGLVGESGSGKTTTGRAVLQLQKAAAGSVKLSGRELTTMAPAELRRMRRHMQFVLQNPYSSLHPRMRVADILAEPLKVHGTVAGKVIPDRVAELMGLVKLDPAWVNRYPHEFSGGQRQRIVIARALAVNPAFVVCDEPVSALDVRTQAEIVDLLGNLQERLKISYLFIAHDLAIVRAVAHDIAVMYGGRIVEMGSSAAIYGRPIHPYTRNLLDAVPVPDPAAQRARLSAAHVDPDFRDGSDRSGPCPFGVDHAKEASPEWHRIGKAHHVSCRFWPPGTKPA